MFEKSSTDATPTWSRRQQTHAATEGLTNGVRLGEDQLTSNLQVM
jgi:hypothetical protein